MIILKAAHVNTLIIILSYSEKGKFTFHNFKTVNRLTILKWCYKCLNFSLNRS